MPLVSINSRVSTANKLTPGARALRDNCMRTLIVSSGWHTRASIIPAPPPAIKRECCVDNLELGDLPIKLTAGEVLLPLLDTFLADMIAIHEY